ncbi:MAG: hypothetical protein K2N22_04350 [Clostridia bacterium]|nr:hypothetical protein [Clostridia bacterium]
MTEEEKQNILGELYSLRAGISLISEECDKIKEEEQLIVKDYEAISNDVKKAEYEYIGKYLLFNDSNPQAIMDFTDPAFSLNQLEFFQDNALGLAVDEIAEDFPAMAQIRKKHFKGKYVDQNTAKIIYGEWMGTDEAEKYYCDIIRSPDWDAQKHRAYSGLVSKTLSAKGEAQSNYRTCLTLTVLFALCLIGFAIGTFFMLTGNRTGTGLFWFVVGGLAFSLLLFVVFISRSVLCKKKYKYLCGQKDDLMSDDEFLNRIHDLKVESSFVPEKILKSVAPYINKVELVRLALKKRFDGLLDERDWKNLDLVIFYLETRRADSVKEALLLVDRELQTQRIEKMISMAAQQIDETLRMGFARLQSTLEVCFESISNQLADINTQLQALNRQTFQISSQLLSAQQLNGALLKKSNQSSEIMVSELRQIRNNSNYQTLILRGY